MKWKQERNKQTKNYFISISTSFVLVCCFSLSDAMHWFRLFAVRDCWFGWRVYISVSAVTSFATGPKSPWLSLVIAMVVPSNSLRLNQYSGITWSLTQWSSAAVATEHTVVLTNRWIKERNEAYALLRWKPQFKI